ncbi:MAG: hypothetical protein RLO17_06505 [Cyclobacteriaceae bacterium]
MSDKLKYWVDQSREEFELFPFDENQGWRDFEKSFVPRRKKRWKLHVGYAAAACVMFVAGWFSFMVSNTYQRPINPMVQEWMETERFYQQEINEIQLMITSKVNDPLILEDLNEMDVVIASLKKDLRDNMDNEEVIMAVMDQYRLKLKILERMLDKLQDDDHIEVIETNI